MTVTRWEDTLPQLKTPPVMAEFACGISRMTIESPTLLQLAKIRLLSRPKINWNWKLKPEELLSIEFADKLRGLSMDGMLRGIWFHVPNESRRHPIVGAILKAMGMISGTPDFVFMGKWGSGVIELKSPATTGISPKTGAEIKTKAAGVLTEAQKDFRIWCHSEEVPHAVCDEINAALDVLSTWGALS